MCYANYLIYNMMKSEMMLKIYILNINHENALKEKKWNQ